MYNLIEKVGNDNGFSTIDIWNCQGRISRCLDELIDADIPLTTDGMIVVAIEFATSLMLQKKYKDVVTYANSGR